MENMLFFVNPNAGSGSVATHLMQIIQRFAQADFSITVYPTSRAKEITDVIAQRGGDYHRIVATGGDGTFNEAVSGLMRLEQPPILGYLPSGTTNDVASSLGLSLDTLQAANIAVAGTPRHLDVGSFNDLWFTYVAAFGAFSDVAYSTPQEEKRILGRMAYVLSGVKSLVDIRPIPVTVEWGGGKIQENILFGSVSSSTSIGGIKAIGDWDIAMDDGLFEVILVREMKNLRDFPEAAAALARQDFDNPLLHYFKTNRISFTFDTPTPWTLDGEFGGNVTQVAIKNHKQAIQIMAP
ncbi:MAG: diacylglycerol kinase family lipid kinase [Eubacteriales bacterium]